MSDTQTDAFQRTFASLRDGLMKYEVAVLGRRDTDMNEEELRLALRYTIKKELERIEKPHWSD